jgi:hypothetical protein
MIPSFGCYIFRTGIVIMPRYDNLGRSHLMMVRP